MTKKTKNHRASSYGISVPHSRQNLDSAIILHLGHIAGEEPHSPQNFAVFCTPHLQTQLSASGLAFFVNIPPPLLVVVLMRLTDRDVCETLFIVRLNVFRPLLILSKGIGNSSLF
jgi:hypothetical protein